MAVADCYDALTHDRPYRTALDPDHALAQLQAGRGTGFEPRLVDAFRAALGAGAEAAVHS